MIETLYCKDNTGAIRVWMCEILEYGLLITHGQHGGSLQEKEEPIMEGIGGRTLEEQIKSRFYSRVNNQLKKGYVTSKLEAENNKRTNAIGLLRPMLAYPIKKVKGINYEDAYYQHKYDGNRCLVTRKNGETIAYSRNGKRINSIGHIIDRVELREGETIDGELYCHGISLQKIGSWIKREQEATKNLSLRVYDTILDRPYGDRLERIRALELGPNAEVVPTVRVNDLKDLERLLEDSLKGGYEGGILRWGDTPYEDGKRSKNLAKIKVFEDEEFEVIDINKSKDGWAILVMITDKGVIFEASAPGTMHDKYTIARFPESYIGKFCNVKFANYTKDNVPFHPTAMYFRDKDEE